MLVAAEREPLVQGAVQLPLEFADAPAVGRGLDLVETAGFGVSYRQQGHVVGPAERELAPKSCGDLRQEGGPWVSELVRRRRTNPVGLSRQCRKQRLVRHCGTDQPALAVEMPIELQSRGGSAPDSHLAQPVRHAGEESNAILGPVCAALFVLHEVPSEQPVPHDQRAVHGAGRGSPSLVMGTPAQLDEAFEIESPAHAGSPIRPRWQARVGSLRQQQSLLQKMRHCRTIRSPESSRLQGVGLALRKRMKLSRQRFADTFGLDVRAVQEWEQGRRVPDRAARVLLTVIDRDPEAVVRTLGR